MRAYSLSNFADSFKEQINKFYSNSTKFNSYIGNLNEFPLYETFQNRNFETDIQLPILSNIQVHNNDNNNNENKNNNDDKDKDYNDNSIIVKSTFNSNFTLDSFRDDILRQDTNKSEKLIDEDIIVNEEINYDSGQKTEEKISILKDKNLGNNIKKKRLKHILLIVIIILIIIIIIISLILAL